MSQASSSPLTPCSCFLRTIGGCLVKSLFTLGFRQDYFGGRKMGDIFDMNIPAMQPPNFGAFAGAAPAAGPAAAPAPAPGPGPAPSPSPAPAPAPTPDFFPVPLPYYYPYPGYQQPRTAYQVQAPPVTKVEVAATPIPTAVWIGGGVALAALLAVVAFK